MRPRLLLLPLLALLAALLAWGLLGSRRTEVLPELQRLDEAAPREDTGIAQTALPGTPAPSRREAGAPQPDAATLEDGEDELREGVFADGSVLVEVEVLLPEDMPPRAPHPFVGARVVTQSWVSETETTASHEAVVEQDGVARFRFDGWVHLDWFRADLPARFGLGPAFIEPHVEVDPGSHQRYAMRPRPGGRVRGRVTTLDGSPLGGVEVCAWVDGDGEIDGRLSRWYPGHMTTTSGATGWFEFESLPAQELFVGVRPGEWLQARPDLHGSYGSRNYFELTAGETHDLGTLRLTPRTTLPVTVTDIRGEPVLGAVVNLSPETFADARLLPDERFEALLYPEDATEEEEAAARASAEFFAPWVYGDLEAFTGEAGQVELPAVPGAWTLTVLPRMSSWDTAYQRVVQLPKDELEIRLPFGVQDLNGTVVDAETERPIPGVTVRVLTEGGRVNARTGDDGTFLAEDLVLVGEYRLIVAHHDYFADEVVFPARELEPRLEARRSYQLHARVVDQTGKPVRGAGIQLESVTLDPKVSGTAAALEWMALKSGALGSVNTNKDGSFRFLHLWPGRYEVAVYLPMDTGERGEWGEPLVEPGVWTRWSLDTAAERQRLELDFTSGAPMDYVDYCSIVGTVLDAETNQPLEGAEVEVTRGAKVRVFRTNGKGRYNLTLPTGEAAMKVRHTGYETITIAEKEYSRGGRRPRWKLKRE